MQNDSSLPTEVVTILPTDSAQPVLPTYRPTIWQRVAFWSVFPAVIIAPLWFAFGRTVFGVGGWLLFITPGIAVTFIAPFHVIVLILAVIRRKAYLSMWASGLLSSYYALLFIVELSLVDGGDTTESIRSGLMVMGVPPAINDALSVFSTFVGFAAMVGIIVVLSLDLRNKHKL
jgi:hypothetical protein